MKSYKRAGLDSATMTGYCSTIVVGKSRWVNFYYIKINKLKAIPNYNSKYYSPVLVGDL